MRAATIVSTALRVPDDYVHLIHEMAEGAAAEGIVWLAPAVWLTQGQAERLGLANSEGVLEVLVEAARQAEAETRVGIGFLLQTNRLRLVAEAVALAELAARYAGRGVFSFGLADDEARGPAERSAKPLPSLEQRV